ncbi:Vms1/Ankzf1 family peptidyl-tRNA hydrolase [Saccharomonospora piscinae]|uniref:Rv2629 family ribosome hibernation factor n=1 Tax=Saccharomonospora piscinae TaxID=687388 RepID=UPI0004654BDC|nr:Vms1/Ankzf1 family peptidyl-tRNA hydrolase [Saccharomonospora piscinae]
MDTTRLRELVTGDGPFASVYFDDTHNTEDAAKQRELTWRDLRARLAEQDASEVTLDALEAAILGGEPPVGRSGRALVATADGEWLDRHLSEPPARSEARLSRLPYLAPLVEYGELPPPHVVAVADRIGADITAVDEHGTVVEALTVEGTDSHVHKVRRGGWGHRDLQQHTEELVKQNIERAAERVAASARSTGASLVVVAGESQARKALLDALPEPVRGHAVEVQPGGRKPGSGEDELDRSIDELLADAVRARRDDVVERFTAELGKPTGLAVQGLEAVTTALREHNVATLLLGGLGSGGNGDTGGEVAEVLTGPEPALLALRENELTAQGIDAGDTRRARADEALLVAAVAVGADVISVGERVDLTDGFGALLRHD